MNLPFLKPKGWPKLRVLTGTSRYGYSEDDEIIEQALDELDRALESKDRTLLLSAFTALINLIKNKESPHAQAHE